MLEVSTSERPAAAVPKQHVIALLHGIRTPAEWQDLVQTVFEEDTSVIVEPIKYGYFDLFRFICPLVTRRTAINEVYSKLAALKEYYPGSEISVVAHSFGTYAIAMILHDYPFFKIRGLLLCGSIVHRKFSWARVSNQIRATKVINDCGTKDIWPVFANVVTVGYGATGTFGFGDPRVTDRFHPYLHSTYFQEAFIREYWVPYLLSDQIKKVTRTPSPFWMKAISFVGLPWIFWPMMGLVIWLALR